MKKIIWIMSPFLLEICHDFMLVACMAGPLLAACVFRFGLPVLEYALCNYFHREAILTPYYSVFDMLIAVLTPIMLSFAGVMVILEEVDSSVAKYYAITPVGKNGYLISRIVIPVLVGTLYDFVLLVLLKSSDVSILRCGLFSVGGGLLAVNTALLVVALAGNKMEGMALIKLCGVIVLGIPVSVFISGPVPYLFGIFPSFWMAEINTKDSLFYFLPMVITSVLWAWYCMEGFERRLLSDTGVNRMEIRMRKRISHEERKEQNMQTILKQSWNCFQEYGIENSHKTGFPLKMLIFDENCNIFNLEVIF